jgi:hypothetical protein
VQLYMVCFFILLLSLQKRMDESVEFEQSFFYYFTLLCEHFEFRNQLRDLESSEQSVFIQLLN